MGATDNSLLQAKNREAVVISIFTTRNFIKTTAISLMFSSLAACSTGEEDLARLAAVTTAPESSGIVTASVDGDAAELTSGMTLPTMSQVESENSDILPPPEIGAAVAGNTAVSGNKDTSATEKNEPLTSSASNPADSVVNHQLLDLTSTSATIQWDIGKNATGVVHYGTSKDMVYSSIKENTFKYSKHIQTISKLKPGTRYFVSVESTTQEGQTYHSERQEFTTLSLTDQNIVTPVENNTVAAATEEPDLVSIDPTPAAAVPDTYADGWPAASNGLLPLGGLFYGSYEQGMYTGNSPIALQSARSFRAERSGWVDAIRYPNRTLSDVNVNGRCLPANPDSVWCKCVDAGLDRYTCGYTLGNSYSVGNGGSIIVQIRANDASDNTPSENILAQTAEPFIPLDNAADNSPKLELADSVYIQAGQMYHLVFVNLNPPTSCDLRGVSVQEAASCPRNQGAMGLNGTYFAHTLGLDGGLDPFRGTSAVNFTRNSTAGTWEADPDNITWYELRYEDGSWVGDSYTSYGSVGEGRKSIGGNTAARQAFTVRDSTRVVDGIWLNYGHDYNKSPDGSPLQIRLSDNTGTVLATGSIASSSECIQRTINGNASGDRRDKHCRAWGFTDLSSTVSLIEGNSYSLEIRAQSNGGYVLSTYFPMDYGNYASTARNQWHDAHAEISYNNGSSWDLWIGNRYPKRDFGLLFTLEGMPRRMP